MTVLDLGWWRHERTADRDAMTNTVTGETIVRGELLGGEVLAAARRMHASAADFVWWRFDYRHPELNYPLVVGWRPDGGHVLIDHNLSAEIDRRERDVTPEIPSYGVHLRVDDALMEAFRLWPCGRAEEDGPGKLEVVGDWLNGSWRRTIRRSAITFPHQLMKYSLQHQYAKPSPLQLNSLQEEAQEWRILTLDELDEGALKDRFIEYNSHAPGGIVQTPLIERVAYRYADGSHARYFPLDSPAPYPNCDLIFCFEASKLASRFRYLARILPVPYVGDPRATSSYERNKCRPAGPSRGWALFPERQNVQVDDSNRSFSTKLHPEGPPSQDYFLPREKVFNPQYIRIARRDLASLFSLQVGNFIPRGKLSWQENPSITSPRVMLLHDCYWLGSWFPDHSSREPDHGSFIPNQAFHTYHVTIEL